MYKPYLSSLYLWPTLVLIIFVAFFVGMAVWLVRPQAAERYRKIARSVLDD